MVRLHNQIKAELKPGNVDPSSVSPRLPSGAHCDLLDSQGLGQPPLPRLCHLQHTEPVS